MKRFILSAAWILVGTLLSGCEGVQQAIDDKVTEVMAEKAKSSANVVKNCSVRVTRAYLYTEPLEGIELETGHKLIAVDAEFKGQTDQFDPKYVDVADGDYESVYGAPLDFYLTNAKGEIELDDTNWPESNNATMRLLIFFQVPKAVDSVKLSYGGKIITPQATEIRDRGPSLPKPAVEEPKVE